jgi:predicted transcriptional regulator
LLVDWANGMRYRSRTEIISKVLDAANGGGATRTKIMYRAYLSYTQMKEYVELLTERGLLNYDLDKQTFRTTEKGLRFLQAYNQISDMISEEQSSQQETWIHR